ncbi:MAG TPA: ABC transporter substrate-binding protein, partial [Bellilinea sp.]|nr:ABC transporter substrate-binding protein [Bellilinea sp.]
MRTFKFVSVLLLLAMVLAACAPAATPTQPPAVEPTKAPEAPPAEPTKAPEPTAAPVEPTKAPAEEPLPEGVANILTVKLREGLKWSDGSPLTAQDLVGTYNIYWLQQNSVWALLKDVVAKDDLTVDFLIANPSPRALRLILRSYQPAPYSVYAKWMDDAGKMRADGVKNDSDEAKALLDDLYAFNPTEVVAYGPFNIDAANITEAQMDLVKNPTGYNADKIDFDKVLLYYGETAVSLPLVLAGEIDYSTHGYTPSDV